MTLLRLSIIALLLFAGCAHAIEVNGLYSAKLRVDSQLRKDRNSAQRGALQQVLVKVSGSQDVLQHPLIRSRLNKATEYMIQYRFVNEQGRQLLEATFDQPKVNQLIRQAGFPIWGSRRPLVMVWLAEQQGVDKSLLTDSSNDTNKQALQVIAEERGLATSYPLMDLEELMVISVNDVWGRFYDTLREAGQRYFADVHLVARIYQPTSPQADNIEAAKEAVEERPTWQLEWSLLNGETIENDQLLGQNKEQLVERMVHQVANILAKTYAIAHQDEGSRMVALKLVNIDSISKFVAAKKFLQSLTVVNGVMLESVSGSHVRLNLSLAGRTEDLLNAIALDHRLSEVFDPVAELNQDKQVYEYRWQQ